MDFLDISDDELFMLYLEENEDAKDILFNRLKRVINFNIKEFQYAFLIKGIDRSEIFSEALYALTEALNNYRQGMQTSICSFANICIKRRFYRYYKSIKAVDVINDNNYLTDGKDLINNLLINEMIIEIKELLSKQESEVFDLIKDDYSYKEIAKILGKSQKQIDNTIQRIRKKMNKSAYISKDNVIFSCLFD